MIITCEYLLSFDIKVDLPVKHSTGTIKRTRITSKPKLRKFIISLASVRLVAGMDELVKSNKCSNTGTFIDAKRTAISLSNKKTRTFCPSRREAVERF